MHYMPQQISSIQLSKVLRTFVIGALAAVTLTACQQSGPVQIKADFQKYWPEPKSEARFVFERTLISDLDVVDETSAERFKRMATGGRRTGNAFNKPQNMLARNGRLYVADSVLGKVFMFDLVNKKASSFGGAGSGSGTLSRPLGMAMDDAENIYVIDGVAKRLLVYNRDGKFLRDFSAVKNMDRPTAVAVTPDGSRIYVVDTGGVSSTKHRIQAFDRDGNHLFDIGSRGTEPGQFNLPNNIAIGKGGVLHVVDGGNFRVQTLSADGKFISSFGGIGQLPGSFARPKSIAVDKNGNLYVVDAAFGNVQIFRPDGQLLMWVGERSDGGLPGQYMLTSGVAVDRTDGTLYMNDQFFRKVDVYKATPLTLAGPES